MFWEKGIDINNVSTVICGSRVFLGVGAIKKMDFIAERLKARGINSVLVVTGESSYIKTGAWDHVKKALDNHGISYALYNKVRPNPETGQVDEAVKIGLAASAKAVIGIGGGSPLDAAKSAAILLNYPEKTCRELFEMEFKPESAAPIVAVNLTHGTGTEANRVAVVTIPEKGYKPAIEYDFLYPLYSIDDPALMTGLPPDQTKYICVDAVNHVVEAATTIMNNPLSITLGKEVVYLINKYLPVALMDPEDLNARYFLTYASLISGVGFDNSLLLFTSALEHPLSAVNPDIPHGLGLAILLPAVVKEIYPVAGYALADLLAPIAPRLTGCVNETAKVEGKIRDWLNSIGITERLSDIGFTKEDIPRLVDLVYETPGLAELMNCSTVKCDRDMIERIYTESL